MSDSDLATMELKYTERAFLKQRQSLSLEAKVQMTLSRIDAFCERFDDRVYCSFSAGKDSCVLADLVHSKRPEIPLVFCNTGLEYPEIVEHARRCNAVFVKPTKTFRDVIKTEGFPVGSKKVSRQLRILGQEAGNPRWANTRRLYDTGFRRDGVFVKNSRLPNCWRCVLQAGVRCSERCCDYLKKDPLDNYSKSTGRVRITGLMAGEGGQRDKPRHCNVMDGRDPNSAPMFFWTEADVWGYIRSRHLPYSAIYDMGEARTGCAFCMFGVHLEKSPNRFQRMKTHHPKLWDYCIHSLGIGRVLDVIGVPYE